MPRAFEEHSHGHLPRPLVPRRAGARTPGHAAGNRRKARRDRRGTSRGTACAPRGSSWCETIASLRWGPAVAGAAAPEGAPRGNAVAARIRRGPATPAPREEAPGPLVSALQQKYRSNPKPAKYLANRWPHRSRTNQPHHRVRATPVPRPANPARSWPAAMSATPKVPNEPDARRKPGKPFRCCRRRPRPFQTGAMRIVAPRSEQPSLAVTPLTCRARHLNLE